MDERIRLGGLMLLEFTTANYRSIKDPCTLSMMATHLKGMSPEVDAANVATLKDGRKVLRVAALYGPNAGGKSNLIRAMDAMRRIIGESSRSQVGDEIDVEPFRLNTATVGQPTFMEAVFVAEGIQYRYGFEATRKEVVREWLYHRPSAREACLFERRGQGFTWSGALPEEKLMGVLRHIGAVRPNALLLATAGQLNGATATRCVRWFEQSCVVVPQPDGDYLGLLRGLTVRVNELSTELVARILQHADVGIKTYKGIPCEDRDLSLISDAGADGARLSGMDHKWKIRTEHEVLDVSGETASIAEFDIDVEESCGTKKLFDLSGIVNVALFSGWAFAIDELDARLHPLLTRAIIGLFQDPATNPKDAQLIFASHDASLLEPSIFRRDQVWFVEKDATGASSLRSLAEFRGLRANRSYREPYLEGRLGAVPILRRFGKV